MYHIVLAGNYLLMNHTFTIRPSTHGAIQKKLNGFVIEITNQLLTHW